MLVEVPENEFESTIIKPGRPAVVMFYMPHCPYCQSFMSIFHDLSQRMGVPAIQVDISNYDSDLWDEYHIEAVPTIVSFRNGNICTRVDAVLHEGLNREDLEKEMLGKPECFGA